MRTLSKNQIVALKLRRQGKNPSEISKIAKMRMQSVNEAIKRAKNNIYRATEIVRIAMENDLLEEDQILQLKHILSKT
jgi:transcriptional regulator